MRYSWGIHVPGTRGAWVEEAEDSNTEMAQPGVIENACKICQTTQKNMYRTSGCSTLHSEVPYASVPPLGVILNTKVLRICQQENWTRSAASISSIKRHGSPLLPTSRR